MKRSKYIAMIIVSFLLTCTMFVKLCKYAPYLVEISCDFLAMIGGGILCSTIVSWYIDKQNRIKEKCNRDEQRRSVMASAKNNFMRLFERELLEITTYHAKYLTKQTVEWVRGKMSLSETGIKLVWLLNEIIIAEEEGNKDVITITLQSMEQDKEMNRHLVASNKLYYKSLYQSLSEISTSYNTYFIEGVLNEKQIEVLKELTWDIQDVLLYEPEIGVGDGTILEFKKILFEKTGQYLSVFDVLDNEEINVHYKNVFYK